MLQKVTDDDKVGGIEEAEFDHCNTGAIECEWILKCCFHTFCVKGQSKIVDFGYFV